MAEQNYASKLERYDKQNIWHPFTPMREWLDHDQLVIIRGDGDYLYDQHGRRYIDGVSSLWVTTLGHRHPALNRAIVRQLDKIAHSTLLGLGNEPAALLAGELVRIAPRGLTKVFYSDNGSTAVEAALKIAFQYWRQKTKPVMSKTKFITLANSYHGDTVGSVSAGNIELFHKTYKPLLFKTLALPLDYDRDASYNLRAAANVFRRHHRHVAALVMEPLVQGAGGMLVHPPGYLRGIARLCRKYGVLLILDEVATGFGRTGSLFACEQEGVSPDLLVLAKGITGGYLPLAATLATRRVYDAFLGDPKQNRTFFHGHTYSGNPLACAVALENLRQLRKRRVLQKLRPKIRLFQSWLSTLSSSDHVGQIRQKGFMVGIDLVKSRRRGQLYPPDLRVGARVSQACRPLGLIIRPLGNTLVLMPPLTISNKNIGKMVSSVGQAIANHCL